MKSLDKDIPEAVIIHHICSYLQHRQELIVLSAVSKTLRAILFSSDTANLWYKLGPNPLQICIDGYCPTCHRWKSRGDVQGAFRLLSKCPLRELSLHCFLTDLPHCLYALMNTSQLESLTLRLTNTSTSPPLDILLRESGILKHLQDNSFQCLHELIINSSHLHHVKLAGRAFLLDILGKHLVSLKFLNLSPSGVFSILASRCPNLSSLRVDKASSSSDLEVYQNDLLEELELCRMNFIPSKLRFPNLRKVKLSTVFRMEEFQLKNLILSLPKTIERLSLEIPGSHTNETLQIISKALPGLKQLSLEGAYEKGVVTREVLEQFQSQVTNLQSFELTSTKSVAALNFDSIDSFLVLKHFQRLERLCIVFDEVILLGLEDFLIDNTVVREVHITAKQRWLPPSLQTGAFNYLANVRQKFPLVNIVIDDN